MMLYRFWTMLALIKGTVMGPLLTLVCLSFRKNVVVTWKIVSFSCRLDSFLLKNVIVFIFGIDILKWRPFEKKEAIFDPFFTFLVTREKLQKFLHHISHIHTCILLTLLTFLPNQFWKTIRIYLIWFLFGMPPSMDPYSHKIVSKI